MRGGFWVVFWVPSEALGLETSYELLQLHGTVTGLEIESDPVFNSFEPYFLEVL